MKKISTKELVTAAVFTAVNIVLAQISIPMPSNVPITLQTLAIALCGYALGAKLGFISVVSYVLLGAVGAPVFSHFRGGIGMLLGYTGGFIIGFVPMALLCGLAAHRKMFVALPCGLIGLAACHLLGVIQFSIVSSRPFMDSLLLISLPYLIKDVASVLAAYYLALALRRAVPLLSKRKSTS
ncbi:MAG TPA: biotin transporter BioY [Clostridiales bacterium]|jgi:biotin transport system substrate-specific component|nr:biotin transporter BioY [Clostridiales bacterium]